MAAEERNIYPIPIHQPSGLGGMVDLMSLTKADVVSFRRWVAEYVTRLLAAQIETGTAQYIDIGGILCHNPIHRMDDHAGNRESACGQFLELLGFTDENFIEMQDIWKIDEVEHIHYIWSPQYFFKVADFDFFMNEIQAEMADVATMTIRHLIVGYNEIRFPTEPDRLAVSTQSVGYDLSGPAEYDSSPPWADPLLSGIRYRKNTGLDSGITSIKFYDSLGVEIIKDTWVQLAIRGLYTVSLLEAVTVLSVTKVGEETESNEPEWVFVLADEEITIDFGLCSFDRYYITDDSSGYQGDEGNGVLDWFSYYINFYWEAREIRVMSSNPENDNTAMFIAHDGNYFLRADFEHHVNPDQLAYLISAFSLIDIEEEEKRGGFVAGVIRAILFVAGAWLFYHGATNASTYLWRIVGQATIITAKISASNKIEASIAQMVSDQEAIQQAAIEQAKEEAFANNRADLSLTEDYYAKITPRNPYETGYFLPLKSSKTEPNPFAYGGLYHSPIDKLK